MITSKEKNFVSAVFYVHNCEDDIDKFLSSLYELLEKRFEKYEIICVNDASTDGTKEKIEIFSKHMNQSVLSIINMSAFQGLELSMNAGVDLSIGDFVYEFDSVHMDYDMNLVFEIYRKALEGYDIVAAAPRTPVGLESKLFYKIFNRYSFMQSTIEQERFRVLSRRAINRVKSLNKTLVYRKAVYASCGLKKTSIKYENELHKHFHSSEERENRFDLAMDSLILFTNAIQKASLYISLVFLASTVILGTYAWLSYFSTHKPVEGWTPLMLFLSLGFFGVFLILTVTLQYLSVILRLIFKKKQYLIESIDKMANN